MIKKVTLSRSSIRFKKTIFRRKKQACFLVTREGAHFPCLKEPTEALNKTQEEALRRHKVVTIST